MQESGRNGRNQKDRQSRLNSSSTRCVRGTLYLPESATGPVGAVALAHGWSMVAGGDLEDYAAAVVNQGLAALTFDFRNLGRSDGQPRQEIDPQRQIQDFRSAISYLRRRPEVDRERIGIWGSSYSGGHALTVAAIDKRVKCVVSQVPTTSGFLAAQRRVRYDKAQALQAAFEADREARDAGQPPGTLRMVDADSEAPVAYPGRDSYEYMTGEARRCPAWVNEVTLRSLGWPAPHEAGRLHPPHRAPPLLMIVATGDGLASRPAAGSLRAAYQPKRLLLLPGGKLLGHHRTLRPHQPRSRGLVRAPSALIPQDDNNDDDNNGDTRPPAPPGPRCAAAVGNALEWFDWTLYGTFSAYLAMNLFDPSDPTSALLATLGVFAGGFLARPVGGWLFGRIGDRYGRKFPLVLTMCLLASTSLGIAVLPHLRAGRRARLGPAVRLPPDARPGHGGEVRRGLHLRGRNRARVPARLLVQFRVRERDARRHGRHGAGRAADVLAGQGGDGEWGWRVGFAIGALLGVYALFLRRSASESDVFEHQAEQGGGLKITKRQAWLIARNIVMIAAASNATYYTWVTFAPATAIATKGMDPSGAYTASLIAQLICLLWLPVCGWLADRYGRKPMVMAFGLGVALAVFPVSHLVTDQPWTLFVAQLNRTAGLGAAGRDLPGRGGRAGADRRARHGRGLHFLAFGRHLRRHRPTSIPGWARTGLDWVYTAYVGALGLMAFVGGFLIKETAGMNLNDISLPGSRSKTSPPSLAFSDFNFPSFFASTYEQRQTIRIWRAKSRWSPGAGGRAPWSRRCASRA